MGIKVEEEGGKGKGRKREETEEEQGRIGRIHLMGQKTDEKTNTICGASLHPSLD